MTQKTQQTAMSISHIKDLVPDPRNARKHSPRNVGMVEKALREVGAARSIVIDEAGKVLAGNATIEAAAQAGIERVQVVDADGETIIAVRRSGLSETQKTKLALYDNRASELAEWEPEVLAAIALDDDGALEGLFYGEELEEIAFLNGIASGVNDAGRSRDGLSSPRVVKVVLPCDNLERFESALWATGNTNRAEALMLICEAYLAKG